MDAQVYETGKHNLVNGECEAYTLYGIGAELKL